MRHTVMRAQCGMCGGYDRAFPSTGGGLGVLPRNFFFCKYKLWKGHFAAIIKTSEKKRLKKVFHRHWKKRFLPKKRLKKGLKGFPGRPAAATTNTEASEAVSGSQFFLVSHTQPWFRKTCVREKRYATNSGKLVCTFITIFSITWAEH